ncbi:MAG TPA: TonB family protein, partial [Polyangia bacterium]
MPRFRPSALALALGLCLAGTLVSRPGVGAPAEEPPITATGTEGDYLRAIHRTIHFRWDFQFIEQVADKRPTTDPLNNPNLEAEVLFTVRWDGSPAEVTVSRSSGVPAFDQAAVATIKGDRPFPVPPIDVYGDDGVAHFRWIFARD